MSKKKQLKRTIKLLQKELLWYDEKLEQTRRHFKEATGKDYNTWLIDTWLEPDESPIASGEVLGAPAWRMYSGPVGGPYEPMVPDPVEDGPATPAAYGDVFEGAPDWANYWAQDSDGLCYWYAERPRVKYEDDLWQWEEGTDFVNAGELPRIIDWTETLVARPKKENPSEEGHKYDTIYDVIAPGSYD